MTKSKKFLIALLGATSIIAGALGFAACGGEPQEPEGTYTVTVKDTTTQANAIENVWIEFGYIDTEGGSAATYQTLAKTKTDETGVAQFVSTTKTSGLAANEFNPVENAEYNVRIAEYGATYTEQAYPYHYSLNVETDPVTGLEISSFNFDEDKKATITFDYVPNHYYYTQRAMHPYYRTYKVDDEAVAEEGTATLSLAAKSGVINYFDFSPFKTPGTVSEGETKPGTNEKYTNDEASAESIRRVQLAQETATGKYKISVTSDASASVVMYQFYASAGYTPMNGEGIPTILLAATGDAPAGSQDASIYTGTNYIELDLDASKTAASYYFYVSTTEDCNVTVTVERTGEATVTNYETEIVQPTETNSKKWTAGKQLTLVEVDGSATIVLGNDGYYHVGSVDGPVLLVNLTKTISRVGEKPLNMLDSYIISGADNKLYNYSGIMTHYSSYANDDGVYGVNEDLYKFLKAFAGTWITATASNNDWLIPCQYYAEALTPSDSDLKVGANSFEYNNTIAELTLSVETTGWYVFDLPQDCIIAYIEVDGKVVYDLGDCVSFYAEADTLYDVFIDFDYSAGAQAGDLVSFSIVAGSEPKFEVGTNGNNINIDQMTEASMSLNTASDGVYTLQIEGQAIHSYQCTVTVTIGEGENVVTLNSANGYIAEHVTIAAGAKITVSTPDYNGRGPLSVALVIVAE